jgi:hypothetical protein
MSDLGLGPDTYVGVDTTWGGRLSPSGRFWAFPTARHLSDGGTAKGPVGVMDLRTARVSYYYPDGGRRVAWVPQWSPDDRLVFWWSANGEHLQATVDVQRRQVRRLEVPFAYAPRRVVQFDTATGAPVSLRRGPSPDLLTYRPDLRVSEERPLDFELGSNPFEPYTVGEGGLAVADRSGRRSSLIITKPDLAIDTIVRAPTGNDPWFELDWLNRDCLVVFNPGTPRLPQRYLVWNRSTGRFKQLAQLPVLDPQRLAQVDVAYGALEIPGQSADDGTREGARGCR